MGKHWTGPLTGGAFATLLAFLQFVGPEPSERAISWYVLDGVFFYVLDGVFFYVITMLSLIGNRYAAEEKK